MNEVNNLKMLNEGKSEQNIIVSRSIILLAHMAKMTYSPAKATSSWAGSIVEQTDKLIPIVNPNDWRIIQNSRKDMSAIRRLAVADISFDLKKAGYNKIMADQEAEKIFQYFYIKFKNYLHEDISQYEPTFYINDLMILRNWENTFNYLNQPYIWNNLPDEAISGLLKGPDNYHSKKYKR